MPVTNCIYIASSLGFSEAGRIFMYEKLYPLVESLGYQIIDPWELPPPQKDLSGKIEDIPYEEKKKKELEVLNGIIDRNNLESINKSIGVLAVLDGIDIDSGTAAEIGYCAALSKPILGYRGDFRFAADNEGSTVNLQVEYFIHLNSGRIVHTLEDIKKYMPGIFPL